MSHECSLLYHPIFLSFLTFPTKTHDLTNNICIVPSRSHKLRLNSYHFARALSPDSVAMTDGPTRLPTTGQSALVGQPPNTLQDYHVIRGLFRITGMTQADPMKGYFFAPKPPPGYTHESRVPAVLAGMILVSLFIVVPTGARLIVRARRHQMKFGSDDWVILVAAVRMPVRLRCIAY
jgi:hypothetical protein